MKTLSLCAIVAMLGCVVTSCTTTTLLDASFEGDAVGSSPNRSLPGDPTGDEIIYVPEMEPRLRVEASTVAGSKALHFKTEPFVDVPRTNRYVTFKSSST